MEPASWMALAAATSAATGVGGLAYQAANQPKAPDLTPEETPKEIPNPDDADTKARLAAAQARERKRKSGSILSNPAPLQQAPVQVKSLLGQ